MFSAIVEFLRCSGSKTASIQAYRGSFFIGTVVAPDESCRSTIALKNSEQIQANFVNGFAAICSKQKNGKPFHFRPMSYSITTESFTEY